MSQCSKSNKAESHVHFGNPASSWKLMDLPRSILAFRPTLTDDLALSIEPILAVYKDMSIRIKSQGF